MVRGSNFRMGLMGNALLRCLRIHPEEMFLYGEDSGMGRGIPIMLSVTDRMLYNNEGTETYWSGGFRRQTILSLRESGGKTDLRNCLNPVAKDCGKLIDQI